MLDRVLLIGILPAALLAAATTSTPTAQASEYEDCELARQEYCYGEGNAFDDCFDETDPDAREACMKRTVKLCETVLVVVCEKLPGGSGGSSGSASYSTECPPGTIPDELGRCVAKLQQRGDGPDLDPNDWCPPGTVPGPMDDCVPAMHTMVFTPSDGGGWGLACPPGSSPGPVDGCAPDFGHGDGGGETEGPCPPGLAPGPDDGCIPRTMVMNLGNIEGALAMDALNRSGDLAARPVQSEELLATMGVTVVGDPTAALEATAEAFGADVAEPNAPIPW